MSKKAFEQFLNKYAEGGIHLEGLTPEEYGQAIWAHFQPREQKLVEGAKFYGDYGNYGSDDVSHIDMKPCYDIVLCDFNRNINGNHYAGRLARQTLREIGEEEDGK